MNHQAWLDQVLEAPLDPARPIIDAHHHLWDHPGNRYLDDELLADIAGGHAVKATVFMEIETGYRDTGPEHLRCVGETEYVERIANNAAKNAANNAARGAAAPLLCAGIVPYANLSLGDRVDEVLDAHQAASPRFRGVRERLATQDARIFVHDSKNRYKALDEAALAEGVRLLGHRGLSLDVFILHPQIRALTALARACPDTTVVFDHLGTPLGIGPYEGRREELFGAWRADVAELARCPNVVAKLGGMAMTFCGYGWEKRPLPPTSEELATATRHWYRHMIDCFGPGRCMFESNFPVDRQSCSYGVLWNSFKRIAEGFSEDEKSALFFDTAARVYRLDVSGWGQS